MMKSRENVEDKILSGAGIKPTSNRILVLRALLEEKHPMGLIDLDIKLGTLDKSSIFRVLTLLLDAKVIHAIEDGRGIVRYEICHGHDNCLSEDMHPHFYCEVCQEVTCLEDHHIPQLDIPGNYLVKSVNYMIKGVCPKCAK